MKIPHILFFFFLKPLGGGGAVAPLPPCGAAPDSMYIYLYRHDRGSGTLVVGTSKVLTVIGNIGM